MREESRFSVQVPKAAGGLEADWRKVLGASATTSAEASIHRVAAS